MKKLLYVIVGLGLLVAAIIFVALKTQRGQDFVFKRVVNQVMSQQPESFDGLRVVVCGSASPLGNDPERAQACIAVVTPQHLFLFDVGARAPQRIRQAQLPLARLNGVFLTHYHSDHIAGLPDVNLASWVQGRADNLHVFGPPGVERVVAGFNMAYKLDRGYRSAHHGEALLPTEHGAMVASSAEPGTVVWQDEALTIRSFSVEHPPIVPAVGYRVDYGGRSVVISGDTNSSENLFKAAEGADLLFHDALSRTLLDPMIEAASANDVPVMPTIMKDVIDYHADTFSLPDAATAAGIRQLVFYHMVPVPPNAIAAQMFLRDMPKTVVLAKDLHRFDLPRNSTDIVIHDP